MNYKVLFQKLYVVIIVLLAAVVHLAEPIEVLANDGPRDRDVDGSVRSFGFNNPTIISGVRILDSSGINEISSGLDLAGLSREGEFIIEFLIYDVDGFEHIDVYVALFNVGSDPLGSSDSGLISQAINSGVNDQGLVIRWISPQRATYLSGLTETFDFPITSGANNFLVKSGTSTIETSTYNSGLASGEFLTPNDTETQSGFNELTPSTWRVMENIEGSGVVIQSGVVNEFDASGVFVSSGLREIQYQVRIPIKMSKIASNSGLWNVGIMVHDKLQQEIPAPNTLEISQVFGFSPGGYRMQWYGELSIVANSSIQFGDVQPNQAKTAIQSGLNSGLRITFISNGQYNQRVASHTTWTPTIAPTTPGAPIFAYLVFDSGLTQPGGADSTKLTFEGNRFALQARRLAIRDNLTESEFTETSGLEANPFLNIDPVTSTALTTAQNAGAGLGIGASNFILTLDDPAYRSRTNLQETAKSSTDNQINSAPPTSEVGSDSIFEFSIRISANFQASPYIGNLFISISNGPSS